MIVARGGRPMVVNSGANLAHYRRHYSIVKTIKLPEWGRVSAKWSTKGRRGINKARWGS